MLIIYKSIYFFATGSSGGLQAGPSVVSIDSKPNILFTTTAISGPFSNYCIELAMNDAISGGRVISRGVNIFLFS